MISPEYFNSALIKLKGKKLLYIMIPKVKPERNNKTVLKQINSKKTQSTRSVITICLEK